MNPEIPTVPVVTPKKNLIIPILLVILVILFGAIAYLLFQNQILKNKIAKYKIPLASTTPVATNDPMPNWKTYISSLDKYQFKVPKEWTEIVPSPDSQHLTIFQSPDGLYKLTANAEDNLNPKTESPYSSLDEFINLPYTVKTLTIDDHEARQPLPRSGSYDRYKVYLFSQDLKMIISLELLVGNGTGTDHRVTPEIIQIGSSVFDKILSTFKFIL